MSPVTKVFGGWGAFFKKPPTLRLPFLFGLALLLCLAADFLIARHVAPDADTIQTYSELHAFRDGNFTLHGWMLCSDNFYFTDLMFMAFVSVLAGSGLRLVYITPFLTYALLLLLALVLVARGGRTRGQKYLGMFLVLFFMGIPFGPAEDIFLQSAIHNGTIALSLGAVLCIAPLLSAGRFTVWMLPPFAALIFALTASDPFGAIFFAAPLLAFLPLRALVYRRIVFSECAVFGCALAATMAGLEFPVFMAAHGGFHTAQNFAFALVSPGMVRADASAVIGAFQLLFSARSWILQGVLGRDIVGPIRALAGIAAAALALSALVPPRGRTAAGLSRFLIFAAVFAAGAEIVTHVFALSVTNGLLFPGAAIRYVTPLYVFLVIAGVLEAQRLAHRPHGAVARRAGWGLLVLAALPSASYGLSLARSYGREPPGVRSVPQFAAAQWLIGHGLTYGAGDYWTAQLVGPLGAGKIKTAPLIADGGAGLVPFRWNSDQSLWNKMKPPQFIIFGPGNGFGVTLSSISATFGPPAGVYSVGGFVVAELRMP